MATKVNLDKLLDVSTLTQEYTVFDSKKYQGLKDPAKSLEAMEGKALAGNYEYTILEEDDGNYKKGDLKITIPGDENKYVIVKDY